MDKITLTSILTLVDQLSYNDNEKLEDMIFKKKLGKYFVISYKHNEFTIIASCVEEEIKRFTGSNLVNFSDIYNTRGEHAAHYYCDICKKECVYTYTFQGHDKEEVKEFFRENFYEYFKCKPYKINIDLE